MVSGRGERLLDCGDRLIDQILGDLADDAIPRLLMATLANLAESLGIRCDYDRIEFAVQGLVVEPFGDRCSVCQLIDVGAPSTLAGGVLMAHASAEVSQLEIEFLEPLKLRLERLSYIAHQHELLAVGERDKRLVRNLHRQALLPFGFDVSNGRRRRRCQTERAGRSLSRPSLSLAGWLI